MLNVVLTSLLGFGFWILAARLFSSEVIGRGSALVAAMVLISAICQLNLVSAILRFLPVTKLKLTRAVLGAYSTAAVASAIGGLAFVIVAPLISSEYGFLREDLLLSILFVAAVIAWGVFALQDAVLTSLRRATWVPLENTVFGVLKIAALPLLLTAGAIQPVFVAWALPMILLLIPVNYLIFTRFIPNRMRPHTEDSPIERFGWRGLRRFLAQDYAAWICFEGCQTLLPIIVVAILGSTQGAYFYMPFAIVTTFDLLFVNIGSSLTVEGAMSSRQVAPLVRRTVLRFGRILVLGVFLLIAGADLILLPFGSAYATAGASVLRLMAAASIFRALIALYCAICRVEGHATQILAAQAAAFGLTASLGILFGLNHGLDGVGFAWLLANLCVALFCAPRVIRLVRRAGDLVPSAPV